MLMRKITLERIPPEKLIEMVKKKGVELSVSQAKEVLDLLYILAILEVEQMLKR